MEIKNIVIGVGVLAVGGFLAWKFLKKPTESPNSEPSNGEQPNPQNYTAQQSTNIAKSLSKPADPISNVGTKPPTEVNTKIKSGGKPVQGFKVDPNAMASQKAPFVNAKIMKDITTKLPTGQVLTMFKKGEIVSVKNNYGDSPKTFLESNSSIELKWDTDVYFLRSSKGIGGSSPIGAGGAPQFDGGNKKRHNFPYFY